MEGSVKFGEEGFGVLERAATTLTAEAAYNAPKRDDEWKKEKKWAADFSCAGSGDWDAIPSEIDAWYNRVLYEYGWIGLEELTMVVPY